MICLPKIHKEIPKERKEVKMRPIINLKSAPAFDLIKWIFVNLFKNVGENGMNVKDSVSAVEAMKNVEVDGDDVLVSFDVENMYTNIPTNLAIKATLKRYEEINGRMNVSKNELVRMTRFVIRGATSFSLNGRYYRQNGGLVMGNSTSQIIGQWVLDDLIEEQLEKMGSKPKLILKYVDDMLIMDKREVVNELFTRLNEATESMKFTMEESMDGSIAFLDIRVTMAEDERKLKTEWYAKPFATGRILNMYSNHKWSMKRGIIIGMWMKMQRLNSDGECDRKSEEKMSSILEENGYDKKTVRKLLNDTKRERNVINDKEGEKGSMQKAGTSKMYVGVTNVGIPGSMQRILEKNNDGVVIAWQQKEMNIRKRLYSSLSTNGSNNNRANGICKWKCKKCNFEIVKGFERDVMINKREIETWKYKIEMAQNDSQKCVINLKNYK